MSTRQTLKNFLVSTGRTSLNQTISYTSDLNGLSGNSAILDEGDDLGIDPNTASPLIDFGNPQGLIPDYLRYITDAAGNAYPIDASQPTIRASANARGAALAQAEDQGAVKVFIPSNEYPIKQNYFDASGYGINSIVNNESGFADPRSKTGNDLLPDVGDRAQQSRAVQGTFASLKKYNKYADAIGATEGKFVGSTSEISDETSSNFDENTKYSFQRGLGEYTLGNTNSSKQLPISDMHATAHSMLLKAAGWDTSTTAFTSADPEALFDSIEPNAVTRYPSIIASFFPDQVRPRESFSAPTYGENSLLAGQGEAIPRDGADADYTRGSETSYTPDLTFSQTSHDQEANGYGNLDVTKRNNLRLYQAAIAVVGLSILIQKTFNDFSTYTADKTLETHGAGPFYMGLTTKSKTSAKLRAVFGVALTNTGRFSFEQAVRAGVTLYFGIDLNTIDSSSEVDGPTSSFAGPNAASISQMADIGVNQKIQDRFAQSYGFWNAVSKSCVRSMTNLSKALENANSSLLADELTHLLSSKKLRIANVFAQIGYSYLVAHLEMPTLNSQNADPQGESKKLETAFSIDSFESLPGSRVMKSRDNIARSALALAWRHSAVPSALLLPPSLIQATLDMDYILEGPNAVKQLVGTTLQDKTYVMARQRGRVPIEAVNNLENRLDAEYVPFYFHDLRTNELIGFHAFLDGLTDNYSANYSSSQPHGRADSIKNYSSTKRSIQFSFWVVATSEDDFDEMWAKINKMITLVYPQYTKGTLVATGNARFNPFPIDRNFRFEQPFSQVVGGTPVIRLRIGDVIKSNYSRFNLGRLFGAGNTETGGFKNKDMSGLEMFLQPGIALGPYSNYLLLPLLAAIASPLELIALIPPIGAGLTSTRSLLFDAADFILKNGFVNPLLNGLSSLKTTGADEDSSIVDRVFAVNGKVFLKPRAEPYVFVSGPKRAYVKVTRPTPVQIIGKSENPANRKNTDGDPIQVQVSLNTLLGSGDLIIPDSFYIDNDQILEAGAKCDVTLDECLIDPDAYFGYVYVALMLLAGASIQSAAVSGAQNALSNVMAASGFPINTGFITDLLGSFMRQWTAPVANPITFAMEDSMSRGLAGVVTSMNFNWLESGIPWDTRWNSRAPMACKISIGFDPIHDIAPGLDAYGANRAPNYNVGNVNLIAGDPHKDGGLKSKVFYNRLGR
jgi:hypothetical protein